MDAGIRIYEVRIHKAYGYCAPYGCMVAWGSADERACAYARAYDTHDIGDVYARIRERALNDYGLVLPSKIPFSMKDVLLESEVDFNRRLFNIRYPAKLVNQRLSDIKVLGD